MQVFNIYIHLIASIGMLICAFMLLYMYIYIYMHIYVFFGLYLVLFYIIGPPSEENRLP